MKNSARIALLFLGDLAMLIIAFFLMLNVAFPTITLEILSSHILPFGIIGVLWILVFFIFNFYNTQLITPTIKHLKRIGYAFLVSMSVSVILFYIIPFFTITPKTNLVIWGMSSIILFIAWRRLFYSIFSSLFRKNVIIIKKDPDNYTRELIDYFKNNPQSGYCFTGHYRTLDDFLSQSNIQIDAIIVAKQVIKNVQDFEKLYTITSHLLDFSHAYEDIIGKIPLSSIDDEWFLHNISRKNNLNFENISHFWGRIFALVTLVISFPISLLVTIAILIENDGPLFYSHARIGKNAKKFRLYKFRSMKPAQERGLAWTKKNDPRITHVGKIIRKLHLDEIPQLWNVVRGDMSLIGPRPEIPDFAQKLEKCIPYYQLRHIIKPGFTGWAQIKFRNARGIKETQEKFEYDLYYIKNRNIFMDFGILLRTIIIIFTHDN